MARDFALAAVAGFAAFGALYLLGAFMAASFSIAQWQPTMRVLVGIFGFGLPAKPPWFCARRAALEPQPSIR